MNKLDLAKEIALGADISTEKGEVALMAILNNIEKTLVAGDTVQLSGFGSFVTKSREARTGRNPKTGQSIQISAAQAIKFVPGKGFKDVINGKID